MKTIRTQLVGLATCAVMALPAHAQAQKKPVNIRNAGNWTCAQFVDYARRSGHELEKTAFLQWTAAYMTAAARSNSLIDVFPLVETWEMVVMLGLVCSENPEANFETAVRTTIGRLRPFWIKESSEILTLNDPGGRTVQYYKEAVVPLQQALNQHGAGIKVDGGFGNNTGNAIRALNASRGADGWMTPSGAFLYHLTRPRPAQ